MRNIENLKPEKLGIVLVDLQQGYCKPGSDWERALGQSAAAADKLCRAHVPFLAAIRTLLKPDQFIWLRMEEAEETIAPNMHYGPGKEFVPLCVRGTQGHDYHIVRPAHGEAEFLKFHTSGFSNPALDHYLKQNGLTQLAVTGVLGSRCVNATILGASERGYECIALTDLIGGPETLNEEMKYHYDVTNFFYALPMKSPDFIDRLRQLHTARI